MHSYANKPNESDSAATVALKSQSGSELNVHRFNNRPQAAAQRRLQLAISDSPQVQQLAAYKAMAETSMTAQREVKSLDTPGATYRARGSYSNPGPSGDFSDNEYLWLATHLGMNKDAVDHDLIKLGNTDANYNCHQWALGNSDNAGSPASRDWVGFNNFFGPYGMEQKSSEGSNTVIAVYGTGAGALDHVAVKRTIGWHSKLGPGPLVKHSLSALEGGARYGSVQGYYDLLF